MPLRLDPVVTATYAILSAGTGLANSTVTVRGTTSAGAIAVYINGPVLAGTAFPIDGAAAVTTYRLSRFSLSRF